MVFVLGEIVPWQFKERSWFYKNRPYVLFTSVSLRNTKYPSFSNQIAFPYLAYFSEIVAVYCMMSTDRQHQLVYSISSLKQVRFITTEHDLSLVTRFMLSPIEQLKCMPFSRESVPRIWNSIPYSIKLLKRSPFRKKIKELLLNFLRQKMIMSKSLVLLSYLIL